MDEARLQVACRWLALGLDFRELHSDFAKIALSDRTLRLMGWRSQTAAFV